MHLQAAESTGPAGPEIHTHEGPEKQLKQFRQQSSSLPFGQIVPFKSIGGPTYLTAQTLVQQVAYSLSDRIWTYSPDTFDLDVAVKSWFQEGALNNHGYPTNIESMQIRQGAASIALGYIFSKDFDLKKRCIPQSILASSAALQYLRVALDQLSLLYSIASPFVAHIAAADYAGTSSSMVTDYISALTLAEELGLGIVSSFSAYEAQHMSLFSTLLANVVPTIHIYDGVRVGRETTRVVDVLDQSGLANVYKSVLDEISGSGNKNADVDTRISHLLKAFNDELGTTYGLFEYQGHAEPDSILVVFGTVESSLANQVASLLERDGAKVGVVTVRVYRPFVEEEFLKALPKSINTIGVLGQVQETQAISDPNVHSNLYGDVVAAVTFSAHTPTPPAVIDIKYPREQVWTPISIAAAFQLLVSKPVLQATEGIKEDPEIVTPLQLIDSSNIQQYTFWDISESPSANASIILGQALSTESANNVTVKTRHDNLVYGGIIKTDIRKSKKFIDAPYSIDAADVVFVGDIKLINSFDVLNGLKAGGKLVLKLPGVKDDNIEEKLPEHFRRALTGKSAQLYVLDPLAVESVASDPPAETYLTQVAFLRVGLPGQENVGKQRLSSINGTPDILEDMAKSLDVALRKIEVPEHWTKSEKDTAGLNLPFDINVNSFVGFDKTEFDQPTYLKDWKTAAKGMAFKEAYGTKVALRPDLAIKTHTIHVHENRRLTPPSYDRNIFHIEFDLGDSGLTYEIGEALGIHAENDEHEVEEFIKFYKLDPDEIVEVPSREDPRMLENRTVYQALMQNVDIFGRPPKRFYEALAEFAEDPNERKELLTLGGPEGAGEFKRRAEVDTITFADILLEFPSAHPSFHDIVRIVNPMKRREYSIGSCQKVTPKSVALMIVVVGWVDPQGRDRFGQATRFLNKLKPGSAVTVSVKPSVMKLPPNSTQPLIMAGLGTGLAPFRAFVQHRAWEKAQGKKIGAVLLYMGSRHQREEYCYGEEWEAYQDAGVITLLGRAFSRDQPQKIYIQDRMRETLDDITQAYLKENGAFYLCGPTWPVPDVTNVLEDAIAKDAKISGKKTNPKREIERLKDDLRYVLEVY